jgi:ribonuclease-3
VHVTELHYRPLEDQIGYQFSDLGHLEDALSHRSFRFEQEDVDADNERLEFLGDAVLDFLCAAYLYETLVTKNEGVLTTLRSQASSGKTLAECAARIDLGVWLKMGLGEEQSGGRSRPSNLANALEAVIGAAYIDGGLDAARQIFATLFVPLIESLEHDIWADNPKGKLQEYAQSHWKTAPKYRVVHQEGPPHAMTFRVEVVLADGQQATGEGARKQIAEESAAHAMIEALHDLD